MNRILKTMKNRPHDENMAKLKVEHETIIAKFTGKEKPMSMFQINQQMHKIDFDVNDEINPDKANEKIKFKNLEYFINGYQKKLSQKPIKFIEDLQDDVVIDF